MVTHQHPTKRFPGQRTRPTSPPIEITRTIHAPSADEHLGRRQHGNAVGLAGLGVLWAAGDEPVDLAAVEKALDESGDVVAGGDEVAFAELEQRVGVLRVVGHALARHSEKHSVGDVLGGDLDEREAADNGGVHLSVAARAQTESAERVDESAGVLRRVDRTERAVDVAPGDLAVFCVAVLVAPLETEEEFAGNGVGSLTESHAVS